jgi:hypothetical protein
MIKDFIAVYENAFEPNYCKEVVKYYDSSERAGMVRTRQFEENVGKDLKDGDILNAAGMQCINAQSSQGLQKYFNDQLYTKFLPEYANEFFPVKQVQLHNFGFKIQKTKIGGGYHSWHYENGGREVCVRALVWMLYLNDVKEGGETEFLYQHMRVQPKTGTLVIWPAGFTHTHRGNPPISNDKYIVTGWLEY